MISADRARLVRKALGALPRHQRTAVDFAYYQGLSHADITEHTGVRLGTVKTRLRMALSTLRAQLLLARRNTAPRHEPCHAGLAVASTKARRVKTSPAQLRPAAP